MYEVDDRDEVIELPDAPQPDIGAPLPHLVCDEGHLVLAYCVSEPTPGWDGSYAEIVRPDSDGSLVAIVSFRRPYAHMFGPPNDEAFDGHPLADRRLHPYAVFEVEQSSWVRRLERMNAVHWLHDKERFLFGLRHFVFAFHDSTFECVAKEFSFETIRGSLESAMPRMMARLRLSSH